MVDIDNMTVGQLKEHFINRVIDFPEGCASGKEDFLRHVGLSVPTREMVITATVCVEVSGLVDVDEWIVSDYVKEAIDDNLYIYDSDGERVDANVDVSTTY